MLASATIGTLIGPASAQDAPAAGAPMAASTDSRCMQDLRALGRRMQEDGYWLTGWNDRYGSGNDLTPGQGVAPMAVEPPATTPAPGSPGVAAPARDPSGQPVATAGERSATGTVMQSPWGNVNWNERPQFEIRSLYNAAAVLARRGDEAACEAVLAAASDVYGAYYAQLQELGISPDDVTTWRQEQLVAAVPVAELGRGIDTDNLIGADLRNVEDDDLGEIDDIVLDPQSGNIRYVVVSRGGFLGIGEDRVAVPWSELRVTPGMNTFVLPVSEEAMESAPTLEDGGMTGSVTSVDEYWQSEAARPAAQ